MSTNLQNVAERPVEPTAGFDGLRGLWSRALTQLGMVACGLRGHDPLLQFESQRMFLRCTTCGHESPGWSSDRRGPRLRFPGDESRHRLN